MQWHCVWFHGVRVVQFHIQQREREPEQGGVGRNSNPIKPETAPDPTQRFFPDPGIRARPPFMAKNRKSGRPAWTPTAAQRRMVRNAAATGMSHEEIAIALGVHRHTLEKHCADDLAGGALKRQMEFRDALARAGLKGNVSALKQLLTMNPTLAAPSVEPEKPAKVGKKEQANLDATTASRGTEWGDLIGGNVTPLRKPA